jgi:DNA-binding response OmpR family regulator
MYIALLEDEPQIAQFVTQLLESAGHTVRIFTNGSDIINALARDTVDLFVLDWWVPERSGIHVLKHIRENLSLTTPVVFLTSRTEEKDIVTALNAGADDYCTKPIHAQVLLARITALLRRTYPEQTSQSGLDTLGYKFDASSQKVTFEDTTVELTDKEFLIATYFFKNAECAISRNRLMLELWGEENKSNSRTLDVHVSAVRRKLNLSANASVARLRPVYGFGYRLVSVSSEKDSD